MLPARQAAERLGIKQQTLYSYVSRRVLRRLTNPADGTSHFYADEVQRLALKGRRKASSTSFAFVVASAITAIDGTTYFYRGRNAITLAQEHRFELVAQWLWAASLGDGAPWCAGSSDLTLARQVQAVLPASTLPLDRLRITAAALAARNATASTFEASAVMEQGRQLVAALVDSLPLLASGAPDDGSLAARLWVRLSPHRPTPAQEKLLDVALSVLADHELPASTLAARIAASFRAGIGAVLCTGLSAVGGDRHAGVSLLLEDVLRSFNTPEQASSAVIRHGHPGFGHPLYLQGDPRFVALLVSLREVAGTSQRFAIVEAFLASAQARGLPPPNVDAGLAALAAVCDLSYGAAQAIFAIGRCAGWIAHALEEYAHASAFRRRALYVGPQMAAEA